MAENISNDASTTLNGAIDNSTTSVTVTSGTGFPAVNFRIRVDNEIMLVTSKGAGTNWTVTRNQESSGAASHANGAAVLHVITEAGLAQYLSERYAVVGHDQTQTLAATTYSPTATNVANAGSLSASVAQYMRVGSSVTVSGRITMTPTVGGGTTTQIGLSLPIASNFANAFECAGTAMTDAAGTLTGTTPWPMAVIADATNNRAQIDGLVYTSGSVVNVWYHYTYRII